MTQAKRKQFLIVVITGKMGCIKVWPHGAVAARWGNILFVSFRLSLMRYIFNPDQFLMRSTIAAKIWQC